MNIHSIYKVVSPLFRKRRMERFVETVRPTADQRILDVGGTPWFWRSSGVRSKITVLNLTQHPDWYKQYAEYELVEGNGTQLQYADQTFDLAYSNSVIEHLGTYEQQEKFARELRRVGRMLWVQTPARCFPVEPHLLAPFVHFLPKSVQKHLLRYFTLWGWLTKPSKQGVLAMLDELRLLTYKEMKQLFPDCVILREHVLGWTKSYIAVKV